MEQRLEELENQIQSLKLAQERGRAAPTVDGQERHTSPEVERVIYLHTDFKCPTFSGHLNRGDSLSIEEWIEHVQNYFIMRKIPESEKMGFVVNHLEGEARSEIKFRQLHTKGSVEEVFEVLRELYGCSQSYISLQRWFFNRRQQEGESLLEYSHALLGIMERIEKSKGGVSGISKMTLRDQFCDGVRDPALSRALKVMARQHPDWSWLELRREAVRWVTEGENQAVQLRSKYKTPVSNEMQGEVVCGATTVESDIAELKALLAAQQTQLDLVVKSMQSFRNPGVTPLRPSRFKRTLDGKPICFKCDKPGHLARACPDNLGGDSSARSEN